MAGSMEYLYRKLPDIQTFTVTEQVIKIVTVEFKIIFGIEDMIKIPLHLDDMFADPDNAPVCFLIYGAADR